MSWISRFRNSISRRLSNDDEDRVHERKKKAQALLEQARDQLAQVESIRKSQQQVSESLRKQADQNHFADLIQYGIPVVVDEEEKKP